MNRRRYFYVLLLLAIFTASCSRRSPETNFCQYVDPIIGTGAHGHTFPGAVRPHGMVQLSPDTGIEGWDWCSGYHASDSSIMGFSHTHLQGTGAGDLADILLMPMVGEPKFQAGSKSSPDAGYRSRFSHNSETASPGYYSVMLDDYRVKAELTATNRVGVHRYTFPKSDQSHFILDLVHGIGDGVRIAEIQIGKNEISGLRRSRGWAGDQWVYFVAQFSKDFETASIIENDKILPSKKEAKSPNLKALVSFNTNTGEQIVVKVAISSVSTDGARKNLNKEAKNLSFDDIHQNARTDWENKLSRIEAKSSGQENLNTFYTALYHSMVSPYILNDVDGKYRGMDGKIHQTEKGNTHYTVFSLWDTFRALHPLFTLTEPETNAQLVKSLLSKFDQFGILPIWELHNNETNCMIGYHAIPVIADAILKGQVKLDKEHAYRAMKTSAMTDNAGLNYFKKLGFIPYDKEGNAVSKSLEYAFDDWCIAQVAKKLGKKQDCEYFSKRALNYRNHFDAASGFMRGRKENGLWKKDFNPRELSILGSGDFTEGNAWQWMFFAPQDINGLIGLHGGDKAFIQMLDSMFNQEPVVLGHANDVTGLVGQYAQGNEPSHHVAYLYNYAGQPWKSQRWLAKIMQEQYSATAEGISGNEDCGQMSAWYVLSAMGFYPVNPASGDYIIGTPVFDEVKLHLNSGKELIIKASKVSKDNIYIQRVTVNGKPYTKSFFTHKMLEKGGEIVFEMGPKPNKKWGSSQADRPVSRAVPKGLLADENRPSLFMPYTQSENTLFARERNVKLRNIDKKATIRYTLDGTEPAATSTVFTGSLRIDQTTTVKAKAFREGFEASPVMSRKFIKGLFNNGHKYPKLTLNTPASKPYNKQKAKILNDGELGSMNLRDGKWLGFSARETKEAQLTIDLGETKELKNVSVGVLVNTSAWLFHPVQITVQVSEDGKNFETAGQKDFPVPGGHPIIHINRSEYSLGGDVARFIRIKAHLVEAMPDWHLGAGSPSWMFMDEIIIEEDTERLQAKK
ncbi:MAG: GH92 family glycosyl hydrolase [Cytophagales bacterium]|nr:GH92 family glycosyl hydrolase [Cytophagales bacterium]